MIHSFDVVGWPFPWSATDDLCKRVHREFADRVASGLGGFIKEEDGPKETYDSVKEVFVWTWHAQMDHDPRYPLVRDNEVSS